MATGNQAPGASSSDDDGKKSLNSLNEMSRFEHLQTMMTMKKITLNRSSMVFLEMMTVNLIPISSDFRPL